MTTPRIAYYAPMKAPTHPTPSGDRAMAQSLMGLLERGGAEVILASELRLHDKLGDRDHQQILQQRAADEVGRLIEELPEVDAEVGSIETGTETETVEVPDVDVDVDTQEAEVEVPTIDVNPPEDDS